ncbi:MAG: TM0106 family RecB-like putative nuclease [Pseudomonadota bacterium]
MDHLREQGFDVRLIKGVEVSEQTQSETMQAMREGVNVIAQGALQQGRWRGRSDFLLRVDKPSSLGNWSYEVADAKLARETKAGTILQLCLYSDMLAEFQGVAPDYMYVIPPWTGYQPQRFRVADFGAYFRQVKRAFEREIASRADHSTYPEPVEYCSICTWQANCEKRWRDDDHLCLVAGISKSQINELKERGVSTVQGLSDLPLPIDWRPQRGVVQSYERVREQARVQVEARQSGKLKYELFPVEEGFGLTCLPEPSPGDVFFDLEGDPFVGESGLEYLVGYLFADENGEIIYRGDWAFSRDQEKQAFEAFVDFIMARWKAYPDLHIYHYAPYEPAALKRLMGRYGTREEEVDQMLRAKLFVDLYSVVRNGLRASVESYSIKRLEPFYDFERSTGLVDANKALAVLQAGLELDDIPSISEETKEVVSGYNRDDCRSTLELREWLETLRDELVAQGIEVPRPAEGDGAPSENVSAWLERITPIVEALTTDVPVDPEDRNPEQHARWILANLLDWHRREEKAIWWEYFRLSDLSPEDLLEERAGLSGLVFQENAGGTDRAPIHRYSFPPQEVDLRGDELHSYGGEKFGTLVEISPEHRFIDIKKRKDTADIHREAIFAHRFIGAEVMKEALVRLGEYVAENGISGTGSYQAARDLLLRASPRIGGQEIQLDGEAPLDAAIRLVSSLEPGVLPIQGPPGAGKSFTGAHIICELVRQGQTVGITANSHKVILNLMKKAIEVAEQQGEELSCLHKARQGDEPHEHIAFTTSNEELIGSLGNGVDVGGGTAWFWSREDAIGVVDVLFVDEAAQMSLANVIAVSQAAKTLVLIGDPQQLDQPIQGSHPDGCDVSALDHLLGGAQTISEDQGLFLGESWRLHPDICAFTSELFYEGLLHSRENLGKQVIQGSGPLEGSGMRYLPVEHDGNQNSSPEEVEAIVKLVEEILKAGQTWVDGSGQERPVTLEDILIITPYNAQVSLISERLPTAHVGTVDKFQGQEAPISIYSAASSSASDAPRGMEFLYSLNRFNVATSRARCMSILVASPELFAPKCRTPRQIQLTNAFCRYAEMAEVIQ